MSDNILSVKALCKQFGDHKVLNGINVDIKKGDVVAVIGPSGCGKSTFLRCLVLLEQPTAGEITFEGEYVYKLYSLYTKQAIKELKSKLKTASEQEKAEIKSEISKLNFTLQEQKKEEKKISRLTEKTINLHREKIGMVFQQFNLFNNLTVLKNITLAPVKLKKYTFRKMILC